MKTYISIITLFILMGCSNSKPNSSSKELKLDFESVDIGKNSTGVIGKIVDVSNSEGTISATIGVDRSQQGGAGAPNYPKNSLIEIDFPERFQKNYDEKNDKSIAESTKKRKIVLVVLNKNQLNGKNEVQTFKIK